MSRRWTYLVLLFLLVGEVFPLGNALKHLQDHLDCFVKGHLDLFGTWLQHHLGDRKDNVGLVQRRLLIGHVLQRVAIGELHATLDRIQRHAGAWREKTSQWYVNVCKYCQTSLEGHLYNTATSQLRSPWS